MNVLMGLDYSDDAAVLVNTAPTATTLDKDQSNALQSLRGIAASVVLLRHATLTYTNINPSSNGLMASIFNSHASVVIFFVLSGFILSVSMRNKAFSARELLAFYSRRAFRMLPLLAVITILSALYAAWAFASVSVSGSTDFFNGTLRHQPVMVGRVLQGFVAVNSLYVPQNWTIMVELAASLAFPFAFFASRRSRRGLAVIAACCVAASFAAPSGGRWLPLVYLDAFVIGIAAYQWTQARGRIGARSLAILGLLCALVLFGLRPILMAGHFVPQALIDPQDGWIRMHDALTSFVEAVAAGGLIVVIMRLKSCQKVLSVPMLVAIGDASYGIYLTHFLIIVCSARILQVVAPDFSAFSGELKNIILAVCVCIVSFVISAGSYRYFEIPFIRIGKMLAGRLLGHERAGTSWF
jgi:peptidoglycan/LPS O-acetylase OafA/YrhL